MEVIKLTFFLHQKVNTKKNKENHSLKNYLLQQKTNFKLQLQTMKKQNRFHIITKTTTNTFIYKTNVLIDSLKFGNVLRFDIY